MTDEIIVPGSPFPPLGFPNYDQCPPYCYNPGGGGLPSAPPPNEPDPAQPTAPPPPAAPPPPDIVVRPDDDVPEPPPPAFVSPLPGSLAFLMPVAGGGAYTFVPKATKVVPKATVAARIAGAARLLVANPIVAGLVALFLPRSTNKGEKEFLDAYYRTTGLGPSDPRGLPNPGRIGEIEVRAPRYRPGEIAPAPRTPVVLPVGPPSWLIPGEGFPAPEVDAPPEVERGTPKRPPGAPVGAPAAPLDPDEDWVTLPRNPPGRIRRVRLPQYPSRIGDDVVPFAPPVGLPIGDRVPKPVGAPIVIGLPSPIGDPFVDPIARPVPAPRPQPTPVRSPPQTVPFPVGTVPFTSPGFGLAPKPRGGTQRDPQPDLAGPPIGADPCNCAKVKSKPKKKRSDRMVCYAGTYREKRKGLIKHRRERVPCQ